MKEPAQVTREAVRYVVFFQQPGVSEEDLKTLRETVFGYVDKVFKGATVYKKTIYDAEGSFERQPESTYVLEIILEGKSEQQARIDQLSWLILAYVDYLRSAKSNSREKSVWYYEQPITLHKLRNPDFLDTDAKVEETE